MIGIGIIGAGFFGEVHARALARLDGARLVASCRTDPTAAAAFAAQHGGAWYDDWRRLVDDPAVDCVLIATPHHRHEEMYVYAARAGKHIFLEKPMAPTLAACDAMIAAQENPSRKTMIGHVMHFALPCLRAKEIICSGELGRPVLGSSWMLKLWMESNRRPWHMARETGGGMLLTAGIHALDRLVWLMDGTIAGVNAMIGTRFHDQKADDSAFIGLRFADGRTGQVASVGYRNGAVTFDMDLVCENGSLRIDFERGIFKGRDGVWSHVPDSIEPNWMDKAVLREWQALIRSIKDDTPSPVSPEYGRHMIACIEAAFRADRERKEIAVV